MAGLDHRQAALGANLLHLQHAGQAAHLGLHVLETDQTVELRHHLLDGTGRWQLGLRRCGRRTSRVGCSARRRDNRWRALDGCVGLSGPRDPRSVHRLEQERAVRVDRLHLVCRRHQIDRRGHVGQPHRQLVVAVGSARAVLAIRFHQQVEQDARAGQPLVAFVEEVGLANVRCAGEQWRVEQRPDRVEIAIELAVGQPAVGCDDRCHQVAGFDHRIGAVRLSASAAESTELAGDAADELVDISLHRARSGHEIAGYAVENGPE